MFRRPMTTAALARTRSNALVQMRASSEHPSFGVWNPLGPVIFFGAVVGGCWMVFAERPETSKDPNNLMARSGLGFVTRTFVNIWM